jgi:hypothetical protein
MGRSVVSTRKSWEQITLRDPAADGFHLEETHRIDFSADSSRLIFALSGKRLFGCLIVGRIPALADGGVNDGEDGGLVPR